MTIYYVDSTAGGTPDGLAWATAYNVGNQTDWTNVFGLAAAAGDIIYVSINNATVCAADTTQTVNANHTPDNPLKIVVGTPNGATGITPTTTIPASGSGEISGNSLRHMIINGNIWAWGLRFVNMDNHTFLSADNCWTFQLGYIGLDKTASAELYNIGNHARLIMFNSTLDVSGADHTLALQADGAGIEMYGGAITSDSSAAKIFQVNDVKSFSLLCVGTDMTGINSATDLIQSTGDMEDLDARLIGCKMGATWPTLFGSALSTMDNKSAIIVSEEQGTMSAQYHNGNVLEDGVYRDGGAKYDGTNQYTLKIETEATISRTNPLKHLLAVSNFGDINTTTVKVHFATDMASALQDDEIWIEVTATAATSTSSDSSVAELEGTPANYTDESGSEVWKTAADADLTGYQEQSMSVSPTVTTTGLVYVVLCVAVDITTGGKVLYVDPKLDIA